MPSEVYYMGGDEHPDFGSETVYVMGGDDTADFGWFGSKIGHFIGNAAKSAGREIGKAAHTTVNAVGAVGKGITKIPIVGAPLHTIMSAGYNLAMAPMVNTVDAAIHGKRLDKALLKTVKDQAKSVKDVAPYVQMVVSVVPGVGTGVSAALGAGVALASGQRIDKALLAGATSMMPGGPLAQAAAKAAVAGVQAAATGKKLDINSVAGTLLNSLPVNPAAKEALMAGMHAVGAVASGKKVVNAIGEAALHEAIKQLPPDIGKAYQSGLAMAAATVAQGHRAIELASPALLNKLVETGIQQTKAVPALTEARKLAGKGVRGFDLAQGLLAQHSNVSDITHIRSSIKTPDELKAFDMGLAARIGLVTQPPRGKLSPAAQAGRAITHGIQGMPTPQNKLAIMKTVAAHPSAAVGAKEAVSQISVSREPWYLQMLTALGLRHKPVPTVAAAVHGW
jgi:hypothetical protein